MLVLIGESGAGKTATETLLIENGLMKSGKSCTSRSKLPRDAEDSYFFLTKEDMLLKKDRGDFAEFVSYNGNFYGLEKSQVTNDRVVVVEIDGLRQLRQNKELSVFAVYVTTSDEERINRMRLRGDTEQAISERLENDKIAFKGLAEICDTTVITDGKTKQEVMDEVYAKYTAFNSYK